MFHLTRGYFYVVVLGVVYIFSLYFLLPPKLYFETLNTIFGMSNDTNVKTNTKDGSSNMSFFVAYRSEYFDIICAQCMYAALFPNSSTIRCSPYNPKRWSEMVYDIQMEYEFLYMSLYSFVRVLCAYFDI